MTISVPPLRERADDIAELAHSFLFLFNQELGLNILGIGPETLSCLRDYRWPGNVRELQGVLKEAMLRTTGAIVRPEFLPPALRERPQPPATSNDAEYLDVPARIDHLLKQGDNDLHAQIMAVVERLLFRRVLQETGGHLGRACERLGVNRSTLRYKLRELGLSIDRVIGE